MHVVRRRLPRRRRHPDPAPATPRERFKALEAEFHSAEADGFAARNGKFSYRVFRYHDDYLRELSACPTGSVLMEVGGGEGLEAIRLRNQGFALIESDIALGMVRIARRRAEAAGQAAHSVFVVCDAEQLPCPDGSLDAVLIVGALHHLPSPRAFVSAASRALKPGGLLVVGFEPSRWPYIAVYPFLRMLARLVHFCRFRSDVATASIADAATHGLIRADVSRSLGNAGLDPVRLQRIWYVNGFVHMVLSAANRRRPVGRLLELPPALQRALVSFDDYVSKIPLVRELCWHWTVIARKR